MKCRTCSSTKFFESRRGNRGLKALLRPFLISIRCCYCHRKYRRPTLLVGPLSPHPQQA